MAWKTLSYADLGWSDAEIARYERIHAEREKSYLSGCRARLAEGRSTVESDLKDRAAIAKALGQ